MDMELEAR
jgi:hypothetical protein